jgi:glycosyltransferase involved in cell wall biosynthesis
MGLRGTVRLPGARRLEDLPDWYRAADLLVLPSRSEGIPNVILEASACGTPAIATSVGGVSEILPPDRLVPPGDPEALARAIGRSLDGQLAAPGQKYFGPTGWRESARALAGVLEQVLPARRRMTA